MPVSLRRQSLHFAFSINEAGIIELALKGFLLCNIPSHLASQEICMIILRLNLLPKVIKLVKDSKNANPDLKFINKVA